MGEKDQRERKIKRGRQQSERGKRLKNRLRNVPIRVNQKDNKKETVQLESFNLRKR